MPEQKSRAGCTEALLTQMPLPHLQQSLRIPSCLSTVPSAGEIMKMTGMILDLGG